MDTFGYLTALFHSGMQFAYFDFSRKTRESLAIEGILFLKIVPSLKHFPYVYTQKYSLNAFIHFCVLFD